MNRRTFLYAVLTSLLSSVFAEPQAVSVSSLKNTADDFELPDDVEQAEIIRFVPIEATFTSEKETASNVSQPETKVEKQEKNTAIDLQQRTIPQELNRPLRVGIFIGVKELYLRFADDEIKITPSGNNIKLTGRGQSMEMEAREFANEDGSCIAVAQDTKSLKTACYPGSVLFRAVNGKLDAINSVDVEDYLRGVVPYEIGRLDSSRIEALKAQAVAARTYAYKHYGSREALGFDVYADTKDQVYRGLEGATPLTDAAIKATEGVSMMYNGEFIIAYYHSTCGGTTETLSTWNRPDIPYLKSQPDLRENGKPFCDESSYMKWERRFADKDIVAMFKKNVAEAKATFSDSKGNDFKKIKSISIKDKLSSGRIRTLQVKTDKGTFDVLTDRTRWLFKSNGTILPSSLFEVKHEKNEWILTGSGFGHGVGMCQMGVRARAQAGQSYQKILTHYYPGITLEKFTQDSSH